MQLVVVYVMLFILLVGIAILIQIAPIIAILLFCLSIKILCDLRNEIKKDNASFDLLNEQEENNIQAFQNKNNKN